MEDQLHFAVQVPVDAHCKYTHLYNGIKYVAIIDSEKLRIPLFLYLLFVYNIYAICVLDNRKSCKRNLVLLYKSLFTGNKDKT